MFIRWKRRSIRYGDAFTAVLAESYRVPEADRKIVELVNAGGRVSRHITQRTPRLKAVKHLGTLKREQFKPEFQDEQGQQWAQAASIFIRRAAYDLYQTTLDAVEIRRAMDGLLAGVDRLMELPMSFRVPTRADYEQDRADWERESAALTEQIGALHGAIKVSGA